MTNKMTEKRGEGRRTRQAINAGEIMPCAAELVNGEGGAIKVGTTGTIGSLMTRELEAIKVAPQGAATPRLRRQSSPVWVPCGASPRKIIPRKSSSSVSSSSSNGRADRVSAEEACKTRRSSQRNKSSSPMLHSDGALVDRSPNFEKAKKKGNVHGVEVVDVRCGNPMSSRLRKLGFSKLSETFA
ncbi:uncharacterized protein LOC125536834 isoform X1 [Triticum urartu]|uniref:uncharacterized protein LOC125536834 isoform X1 n=1 Tax=Triticum urartu TaxID=4572 RepID=UPI0020448A3A|nr:uncharacterized protein LOC125536834 isoform X1 [Triticum urartu]